MPSVNSSHSPSDSNTNRTTRRRKRQYSDSDDSDDSDEGPRSTMAKERQYRRRDDEQRTIRDRERTKRDRKRRHWSDDDDYSSGSSDSDTSSSSSIYSSDSDYSSSSSSDSSSSSSDTRSDDERRRRKRKSSRRSTKRSDERDNDDRNARTGKIATKNRRRDTSDKEDSSRDKEVTSNEGAATAAAAVVGVSTTAQASKESDRSILSKLRTGGVYIPPHKLRRIQDQVKDPKSVEYQRLNWDALGKSINGFINKINVTNIKHIVPEVFKENIIRGRGLLTRSLMKAQAASPEFTQVYAALLAVINTKIPEIGELVLKRLIIGFRRSYRRNDKARCIASCKFIAHLVNQQVCHEILAGQMLGLLLERPTDDSVELAVSFMKECGYVMNQVAPRILNAAFERFRSILHEGQIDKRVQFMIEDLFAVRKTNFKNHPGLLEALDLVEPEDQITHELELDQQLNQEDQLDYFHYDEEFEQNELKYQTIKREILGIESDDEDEDDDDDDEDMEDEFDSDEDDGMTHAVQSDAKIEKDEQEEVAQFKKNIYLAIMSSLDFEECAHKILKSGLCRGREMEVCSMIIECCAQERTYMRFYGLLAQRFCQVDRIYQEKFEECFQIQYSLIHRLETNKMRNVAKLFAHILFNDVISWSVMEAIRLTQEDTTSSSRIFVKILFQELAEQMGLQSLNSRLNDPYFKEYFDGLFPTDHPKNMRFSINFWTSIGMGALTESLREVLAAATAKKPK